MFFFFAFDCFPIHNQSKRHTLMFFSYHFYLVQNLFLEAWKHFFGDLCNVGCFHIAFTISFVKQAVFCVLWESGKSLFPYPCCVKNCSFAVRKNADGPRRQMILLILKCHSCRRFCVIVCKKCSTGWFGFEYMNLENEKPNEKKKKKELVSINCQKESH